MHTPAVATLLSMPQNENDTKTALKDLLARFEDATNRARELGDAWVRYLVAINSGAIAVTLGLASAYSDCRVSPSVFGLAVGAFTVGLLFAGLAMFLEHNRQNERANMASNLRRRVANGELTVNQSRDKWNELITSQGKRPWPRSHIANWRIVPKWFANVAWTPPRNAALISFVAFLLGIVFNLWALGR